MNKMMKMLVVSLMAVLAITSVGSAASPLWNNADGDNSYTNNANWDTLAAPGAADVPSFGPVSDEAVLSTNAYASGMNMGLTPGVTSNLRIANGGYLHINTGTYDSAVISYTGGSAGNLIVDAGGRVDVAWQLTVGQWGDGKVTLNGGTLTCQHLCFNAAGTGNASSFVDVLNGGKLQVGTQFIVAGWNAVGPVMNVSGTGQILANAGAFSIAAAKAWANLGYLTGNGLAGEANILATNTLIGGTLYTKVVAVPEPLTLTLLAAGGLFLRRKSSK